MSSALTLLGLAASFCEQACSKQTSMHAAADC